VIEEPLFPGYVFCRFDPSYRLPVLQTPGVVVIVGDGNGLLPIPEHEIGSIRSVVNAGCSIEHWDGIKTGEAVEICDGPLTGVRGLLIRKKGSNRLVVSVGVLERSVAVEVDGALVRPLRMAAGTVGSLSSSAA
jgi:transcription antitermination factor NusG